jgi:hypothetical protein
VLSQILYHLIYIIIRVSHELQRDLQMRFDDIRSSHTQKELLFLFGHFSYIIRIKQVLNLYKEIMRFTNQTTFVTSSQSP